MPSPNVRFLCRLLFLSICLSGNPSAGAAPAATATPTATALRPAPSLRFEHIGLEQGMPQESVLTILQDRTGFMWFGTQAGLVRFDGYRPHVFRNDPADAASLVDNYVNCSHEDQQGRLWFGTRGGLVRFDAASQSFVRYPLSAGGESAGRNAAVNVIVGDGADGLWIGTGAGLVHLDTRGGGVRTLRRAPGDPGSDRVNALARDATGGLWIGGAAGLDYLAPGATRFRHVDVDPAGGKRNAVWSLALGADSTLWVGTGAGLEAWRVGAGEPRRRHLGPDDGMDDARVLALYHDKDGGLWVGTDLAGLKRRARGDGRFTAYTSEALDRHSLSDNQVAAVRVDRTGTLWVGTIFGGVNRVDLASGGFDRFLPSPGPGLLPDPNSRKIRAIAFAPDGNLWLGTTGAGLLRLDPASGRGETVRHAPGHGGSLPDDVVTAVLPAGGRLWVGAATGLSWRPAAGGRFTPVTLGHDAASNAVQALMRDRAGALWVLTRGGLFMLDDSGQVRRVWRHEAGDPASLGENFGFSLAQDAAGTIWIGTENGLDRLDGFDRAVPTSGRFTHFRHDAGDPGSLRHSRVYHVFASGRGDLWVGTGAGLHRLERRAGRVSFRLVPLTPGREQAAIGAILEDDRGRLWVSTTAGIARVDPAGSSAEQFTASDGLIDGSYLVGAAARGPDGRLYFGGVNGMTSFVPDAIRGNPFAPDVVITELSVPSLRRAGATVRRPVAPGAEMVLDYRDPGFTLEFAALHYADPASNRYAYRLRGFDKDWLTADAGKRYATYTNLDPGNYVFEVRAANKDGVWSAQPARLALRIAPPFWMTWWFRLGAGIAALAAAAAAYRLRVRVLVQRTERLERQVAARTAELVLQKEGAERQRHEADVQREAAEQARRDIALLSDIGRELTANLDSDAIMAGVSAQVRRLMDADLFAFGVVRAGGRVEYPFVAGRGMRLAAAPACPPRVERLAERGAALFEEMLIDDFALDAARYVGSADADDAPGARDGAEEPDVPAWPVPRSLLLVPIVVGSRALGVLLVQSARPAAYQRVQLDMLGTLASYAGVALDNADAYRRLKETQVQLAASEKLAGLGALVAGVAHELNTPIGNSLLMASTLADKSDDLAARLAADALRRSELDAWLAAVRDATGLIVRSLQSAADLVNSFKQVSVDQASAQRRAFDLATACHEITATMMNQVRRAGHRLELRVAPGISMDSYPGPLGQVLINFINNALLHAFEGPGGTMVLEASTPEDGRVRIAFGDDGSGIAPENLSRVFDPFFTTRMGQGGTGLGLNIAWTIVTTLLGGTMRVESAPGKGTTFILDLPLRAG